MFYSIKEKAKKNSLVCLINWLVGKEDFIPSQIIKQDIKVVVCLLLYCTVFKLKKRLIPLLIILTKQQLILKIMRKRQTPHKI